MPRLARTAFAAIAYGLIGFAALVAIAGRTGGIGGYRMYAVATGSMEPALPVGSLLLVRTVPIETIRAGDVVTFQEPGRPGVTVTHRVAAVGPSGALRTKGDANPVADPWQVDGTGISGRVVGHMAKAGTVITLLSSKTGIFWLVLVPLFVLVFLDIDALVTAIAATRNTRHAA